MIFERIAQRSINIKELSITPPEKRTRLFDQKEHITPSDLIAIKTVHEDSKVGRYSFISVDNESYSELGFTTNLRTLYPERKEEFSLEPTKYTNLKNNITRVHGSDIVRYAQNLYYVKVNFPDQFHVPNRELQLFGQEIDEMRNVMVTLKRKRVWREFSELSYYFTLLFPERRHHFNVTDYVWKSMHDELEKLRNDKILITNDYEHIARSMKVISPERANAQFTASLDWDKMHARLASYRQESIHHNWLLFTDQAATMKILAAPKLNINSQGLEIESEKPSQIMNPTPPFPEVKKF